MTFDDILAQVLDLLQREKRVAYWALKRRFDLDDNYLEDVKDELINAKKLAVDEEHRVLVWAGEPTSASTPPSASGPPALAAPPLTEPERAPLVYTPQHLAEKILTSRSALEGERKHVTVLFADLKGSLELLADRDPEEARQLLDPVLERMMAAVHRYETDGVSRSQTNESHSTRWPCCHGHTLPPHWLKACHPARNGGVLTTTIELITDLFCRVDDRMRDIPKHPEAHLWPSEVVTLGLLHALKGVGNRPFYRWLTRDYRPLFPRLPERTRLFRLLKTHQDWTQSFMASPTVLGVIDTYGIELIHPIREGRSPQQIGRKGLSNHRWIVGGKLCLLLNQYGLVVGWDCATANVPDKTFQWLIRQVDGRMIVLSDTGFHAAEGDPANLKLCPRGEWPDRMLVETVLSMLTVVCHLKKVMHRGWAYFQARLAFTMAAFNVLVQWHGFQPYASGFVPLSIAEFSL